MSANPAARKRWYPIVRQLHLWIGAWGALAAILFGASGLVLNHRFAMKVPQGARDSDAPVRISVPVTARATPDAMARWLTAQGMRPLMQRVQPAAAASPDNAGAGEPEQWSFSGGRANASWDLDYAAGDASAELQRTRYSPIATLLRLHKSLGGGVAWILLGDSFAVAMVLLGLSGIAMWSRGRSPKELALSVLGASVAVSVLVLALG